MKNIKEGHPSHVILSKEIKHKPNFDIEIAKQNLKSDKQLKKYFTPTEANWGPKARATGKKEKNPASQK